MPALPDVTEDTRAFWTGGERGELCIHRCRSCARWFHPPAPVCPYDLSLDVGPDVASGRATVLAYTINEQPWMPEPPVPYVLAIVGLDEDTDVHLTTRLVNCEHDDVRVDLPVRVVFEPVEDVWLPLFEPDRGQA